MWIEIRVDVGERKQEREKMVWREEYAVVRGLSGNVSFIIIIKNIYFSVFFFIMILNNLCNELLLPSLVSSCDM